MRWQTDISMYSHVIKARFATRLGKESEMHHAGPVSPMLSIQDKTEGEKSKG